MTIATGTAPGTLPARRPWASSRTRALGVDVELLVTAPLALEPAFALLHSRLDELDRACSRFRNDSELTAVNRAGGRPTRVGPLLAQHVAVALRAAERTRGALDPTTGSTLVALGYDRTFASISADGPAAVRWPFSHRPASWRDVRLDARAGTVTLPPGVLLDLGATAKAAAADAVATEIAEQAGCGVLVNLGGDLAVAGPPPEGGWPVRVQDRPGAPDGPDGCRTVVTVAAGGLATSSTTVRRWRRDGRDLHHLVDPRTGAPAVSPWRTVTVAAASCEVANTVSTATIVRGAAGLEHLERLGLPARLVSVAGDVTTVGGWPDEDPA